MSQETDILMMDALIGKLTVAICLEKGLLGVSEQEALQMDRLEAQVRCVIEAKNSLCAVDSEEVSDIPPEKSNPNNLLEQVLKQNNKYRRDRLEARLELELKTNGGSNQKDKMEPDLPDRMYQSLTNENALGMITTKPFQETLKEIARYVFDTTAGAENSVTATSGSNGNNGNIGTPKLKSYWEVYDTYVQKGLSYVDLLKGIEPQIHIPLYLAALAIEGPRPTPQTVPLQEAIVAS